MNMIESQMIDLCNSRQNNGKGIDYPTGTVEGILITSPQCWQLPQSSRHPAFVLRRNFSEKPGKGESCIREILIVMYSADSGRTLLLLILHRVNAKSLYGIRE